MSTSKAINPLPPEAIARLKASSHIANLSSVIIDLLKNSLDAGSRNISVTVDFLRGGCVVEDDGTGIPATEFLPEGGLCKPYHTSRYASPDDCYGRSGLYLASLSALSLLSVSSKHQSHPSVHEVILHHGKAIHSHDTLSKTQDLARGTRVAVRDLFGNMPVRVKQRGLLAQNSVDLNRLWEQLRHSMLGLLIACGQAVCVRVRDPDKVRSFSLNGVRSSIQLPLDGRTSSGSSSRLKHVLSLLAQSSLTDPDLWPSWVPVSASSSTISVKGAISLEPVASKNVQFISLGIYPVAQDQTNELYGLVNKLFSNSYFGTEDENASTRGAFETKVTATQPRSEESLAIRGSRGAGKGTHRYPQFWLAIKLKNVKHTPVDLDVLARESTFKDVAGVVEAMVYKWLDVNHFRPSMTRHALQQRRSVQKANRDGQSRSRSLRMPGFSSESVTPVSKKRPKHFERGHDAGTPATVGSANTAMEVPQNKDFFGTWSRIKSSDHAFRDSLWQAHSTKPRSEVKHTATSRTTGSVDLLFTGSAQDLAALSRSTPVEIDSGEAWPKTTSASDEPQAIQLQDVTESASASGGSDRTAPEGDQTMPWRDPYTDEVFLVNSRTGVIIHNRPNDGALDQNESEEEGKTLEEFKKPIRLACRPKASTGHASAKDGPDSWLSGALESWSNPVFRPMEENRIPAMEPCAFATDAHRNGIDHISCHTGSRLDKPGLNSARVIAQVDKKFILARLPSFPSDLSPIKDDDQEQPQTLALIDQHAASERVTLERLFAQFFAAPSDDSVVSTVLLEEPLCFTIKAVELAVFEQYKRDCGHWGMSYTVSSTTEPAPLLSHRRPRIIHTVTITTLPTIVTSRILAEPKLASGLIRSYTHDLHASNITSLTSADLTRYRDEDSTTTSSSPPRWLHFLPKMPRKLLDLLNSRSCRSAIMFNDELSIDECKTLVEELAGCVFPFVCAHGRPSAIVLGNLPSCSNRKQGVEDDRYGSGFGTGFGSWEG